MIRLTNVYSINLATKTKTGVLCSAGREKGTLSESVEHVR